MYDNHLGKEPHDGRDPMLRANLLGLGLTAALILFLASAMPPVLLAPTIANLATIAAVATSALAILLREHPLADTLTRWDQAAALLAMSFLARFFTDPAAVQAYLQSAAAATT